jgi:hypothetical protein
MKQIFIVLLLSVMTFNANAQKHIKGQKLIALEGGLSRHGGFGRIGGGLNTSNRTFVLADFMLESGKILGFRFSTYNVTGVFYANPLKIKEKIYFNVGLGLTANVSSVEGVKFDENGNSSNLNNFNYGAVGAIQAETYFTKRLAWLVTADQRWYVSNKFGSLVWYAGTGIKFII